MNKTTLLVAIILGLVSLNGEAYAAKLSAKVSNTKVEKLHSANKSIRIANANRTAATEKKLTKVLNAKLEKTNAITAVTYNAKAKPSGATNNINKLVGSLPAGTTSNKPKLLGSIINPSGGGSPVLQNKIKVLGAPITSGGSNTGIIVPPNTTQNTSKLIAAVKETDGSGS